MKKIIFIFISILCLCASNVQAQYKSFFADSTWQYNMAFVETCYFQEDDPLGGCIGTCVGSFNKKDTIWIDSTLYYYPKYIWGQDNIPKHYIREDTLTGQLFRYNPNNQKEYLLCDMSLNVGDTFNLFDELEGWIDYWQSPDNGDYYVDSVYFINDIKILELHRIGGNDGGFPFGYSKYTGPFRFIEGVGPLYGIGVHPSWEICHPLLLCLTKDDTLYYMTHEDLQCYQTSSPVLEYENSKMLLYPNPAKDKITIELTNCNDSEGILFIMDMTGRIIYQQKMSKNSTTINISNYSMGLYTVIYQSNNKKVYEKFIRE